MLNWPEATSIDDVKNEEVWVWLGFVKPGTHSIIIKDLEEKVYQQSIIVETRNDAVDVQSVYESRPVQQNNHMKGWDAPFTFQNWKTDDYDSLFKAHYLDQKFWMVKRNMKGTGIGQFTTTTSRIWENFAIIKNYFVDLSAQSAEYPGVDAKTI